MCLLCSRCMCTKPKDIKCFAVSLINLRGCILNPLPTEIADPGAGAKLADRVRDITNEEAGLGHRLQLGRRIHTRILVRTCPTK